MSSIMRISAALFTMIVLGVTLSAEDTQIAFSRDIRPILAGHCFQCHGPDEASREAGLRLDTEQGARQALEAEDGITKLLGRVTSHDPDLVMPPTETKKPLKPAQIQLLTRWVAGGAQWGSHWAFETLLAPAVPEVALHPPRTLRNPIDHFVQGRLAMRGILASPEASSESLIRRVTLDLTGLPPTLEEVDAFVGDTPDDAWEKVVDRLLGSTAY